MEAAINIIAAAKSIVQNQQSFRQDTRDTPGIAERALPCLVNCSYFRHTCDYIRELRRRGVRLMIITA